MELQFKDFLLNENKHYLGERMGDILSALHDLNQNVSAMGTRQQVNNAENISNQIRKILHGNWSKKNDKYLKSLQKVGVAIMRAIEEKDDLVNVLQGSASELEKTLGDMGVPINSLGTKDVSASADNSGVAEPQAEPEQPQQNQQGQQPPPQGQQPPATPQPTDMTNQMPPAM